MGVCLQEQGTSSYPGLEPSALGLSMLSSTDGVQAAASSTGVDASVEADMLAMPALAADQPGTYVAEGAGEDSTREVGADQCIYLEAACVHRPFLAYACKV